MQVPANIARFLMPPDEALELERRRVLDMWRWLVPEAWTVLALNLFGDWFLRDTTGAVHVASTLDGGLWPVSDSVDQFWASLSSEESQDGLLLAGFVLGCEVNGKRRPPGHCYCWAIHPRIGGPITAENVSVMLSVAWQTICAQLHSQLPPPEANGAG
jgi:hypothetical protein